MVLGGCTGQRGDWSETTPAPVPTVGTETATPSAAAVDVVLRDPSGQGQMIDLRIEQGGSVVLDRRLTVWGPRGIRLEDAVPRSGSTDRFRVLVGRDGGTIGTAEFETGDVSAVVVSVFADEVVWTTF